MQIIRFIFLLSIFGSCSVKTAVITIDQKTLIPEGITIGDHGAIYLSNIFSKNIIKSDPDGSNTSESTTKYTGKFGGVDILQKDGKLYALGNNSDNSYQSVFQIIDIEKEILIQSFELADTSLSFFNDLTISANNKVADFLNFVSFISFIIAMINLNSANVNTLEKVQKPSKEEQRIAMESYNALAATLEDLKNENPKIKIAETGQPIAIPIKALKLLGKILKLTGEGKPINIIPVAAEMTTQAAADIIGCSRPHFVKMLEEGKLPYHEVGRHRRVMVEDVIRYRDGKKKEQKQFLYQMMEADEKDGLYKDDQKQ